MLPIVRMILSIDTGFACPPMYLYSAAFTALAEQLPFFPVIPCV